MIANSFNSYFKIPFIYQFWTLTAFSPLHLTRTMVPTFPLFLIKWNSSYSWYF